jgi:hypothetical protein
LPPAQLKPLTTRRVAEITKTENQTVRTIRNRVCGVAFGLAVALGAAIPAAYAQQAAAPKPLAVVSLSGYDELMGDADFLGGLTGQPNASAVLQQLVMQMTQGKGLAGVDKSKPMGLVVESVDDMPGGAVCIPVTDVNALLEVAKGFGVTADKAENGLQKVTLPQGQSGFLKSTPGWALISLSPQLINAVPADPNTLLGPLAKEYDVAVQIHVQNVPETYRQQAVDAMSQGAQQGLAKKEGESDEEYAKREKVVQMQLGELKRFMNELDQFTVGLSIDSKQQRAFLDIAYTGVAGSKLAKDLAQAADAKTNFAGFIQPSAAMTFSTASPVTESNTAQVDQMIDAVSEQLKSQINDDENMSDTAKNNAKGAVEDFLAAAKATLKSGTIDGAAALNLSADSLTFVAGGHVAEPQKIESGLKKLLDVAKEKNPDKMPEVSWNSEKVGEVSFSKFSHNVPEDKEDARKLLGDKLEMYLGIGKDTVYFAAGKDALAAVKKAIDASKQTPNKPISQGELTFALEQIMTAAKTFADENDKAQIEAISQVLSQSSGKDHVRIVAQPIENGVRMRIEAEEGVLKAVGMAAMQQQMRAAQGQ